MKKSMLEKYTSRYDKVPSWLMIMLSCFIASGYVLIGGFLAGIVVGVPMTVILSFLIFNGNIQFRNINTISTKLFSSLYFQLGTFVFTALVLSLIHISRLTRAYAPLWISVITVSSKLRTVKKG